MVGKSNVPPVNPAAGTNWKLCVGFVLLPNFTLNAFSSIVDVLRLAADEGDRSRPEQCSWRILAPDLNPITSSCGLQVLPWETFSDPGRFDYIVVVGGLLDPEPRYNRKTIDFLRDAAGRGVRLAGVCTGSFVLAEARLLNGRRCCVSWYHFTDLIERYGDVIPVADQLFIEDGPFITCAGGLASMDLGAWLVERHLGPGRSQKSLHIMVADQARPGASAQPQPPSTGPVADTRVRRAMLLIEQNLSTPQRVDKIARAVGLSKRQLERVFRTLVGKSIQEYSRDLRLLYGLWLLANSTKTITAVASEAGFSDISHFNRLFRASLGYLPSEMRRRGPEFMAAAVWQGQPARMKSEGGRSQGFGPTLKLDGTGDGAAIAHTFLKHENRPYISA